jgi:hypothetical protein
LNKNVDATHFIHVLCAIFLGHSAVSSSSQSVSLALCLDSLSQIDAARSLQCRRKVARLQ